MSYFFYYINICAVIETEIKVPLSNNFNYCTVTKDEYFNLCDAYCGLNILL